MSEEAIEQAVAALEDDEVRERVAGGDFSDLDGLELTSEENEQLQTFASEYTEVEGFGFFIGGGIYTDGVKGPSMIFSRTTGQDTYKFQKSNPIPSRTVSTQPLGGITPPGATI